MKASPRKLVQWLTTKLATKARRTVHEIPTERVVDRHTPAGDNAVQDTVAIARTSTPDDTNAESAPLSAESAQDETHGGLDVATKELSSEPEFIDHFEIRRILGQGGFGSVYLAHDTKLDRIVALKLLDNLDKSAARKMLADETRAASKLKHPNLVTVFQTGEHERGCYIVFEYIPGPDRQQARTLRELLDTNERTPPADAVAIVRQIADALAYAHGSDVIHRDVKPENILMDYKGTAYLADFGCARRGRRHVAGVSSLVGTLPYMSLEQINGQSNVKTDIWSTGIVLYELLSGERPFASAEKARSRSATEAAYRFAAALVQFERLPTIPGIDADLEAICVKCLQKDADKRYDSAAVLVADLSRWERNEPVSCRPVGVAERLRRWSQRNPLIAAQLATIALILVIGFVVSSYFAVNMRRAQQRYVTEQIRQLDQIDGITFAAAVANLQNEPFQELSIQSLKSEWQSVANEPQQAALHSRLAAAIVAFDRAPIATKPDTELVRPAREQLTAALLTAPTPEDFLFLRGYAVAAEDRRSADDVQLIESLWSIVDSAQDPNRRFRALAALTDYDHNNERWHDHAQELVNGLLDQNDSYVARWTNAVAGVGERLVPLLKAELESESESRRTRATIAYSILASTRLELLKRILAEQSPAAVYELLVQIKSRFGAEADVLHQLNQLAAQLNEPTSRELVNLTIAELFLRGSDVGEQLPIFAEHVAAEARYLFEKQAVDYGLTLYSLFDWLRELHSKSTSESVQTALLAMGRYELAKLPENTRTTIRNEVESVLLTHECACVHSSAAWVLRQWQIDPPDVNKPKHTDNVNSWRINQLGQLMVRVKTPDGAACEVTAEEITLGDYAQYVQSRATHYVQDRRVLSWISGPINRHHNENAIFHRGTDEKATEQEYEIPLEQRRLPIRHVSALQAVAYCVWASQRDGIAEDQMCFQLRDGLRGDDMTLLEAIERQLAGTSSPLHSCNRDALGYRPLFSDEWEYLFPALRSSSSAANDVLNELGWHAGNSQSRIWPVGGKRPNALGIFDVYGNVTEWCIFSNEPTHVEFETLGSSFDSDLTDVRPITPVIEVFGGHRTIGYRMIRRLN